MLSCYKPQQLSLKTRGAHLFRLHDPTLRFTVSSSPARDDAEQ